MDKFYWQTIQENNYVIPTDQTPSSLTAELFSLIGSPDPELRDEIAYPTFAHFLERGYYSLEEIEIYIASLLANLEIGIGEKNTDSVFLRSFSVLFLAEIIHNDNKNPQLEKPLIKTILEKGLWYLDAEMDQRGYVNEKGWAHALAHTADLLLVLGKSLKTGRREHHRILNAIRTRLTRSTDHIYLYGEDDRLSRAVAGILKRGTISTTFFPKWMQSFLKPYGGTWKGAWIDKQLAHTLFNVRNFLRSLYLQIIMEEELSIQEEWEEILLESIQNLPH